MAIHVSLYTIPKQVAWSIVYCPHCQQLEAGRCDEYIQVTAICFIPVSRDVSGRGGRCDFCERPASHWMSSNTLPLEAWSPELGIPKLFSLLDMPHETAAPLGDAEPRLHSLLHAIEASCAANGMDVRLGLILGGLCGAMIGAPIGALLFHNFEVFNNIDVYRSMAAIAVAGGVLGTILGGGFQILLTRHRVATRRLREAYNKYGIDLKRLEEIAIIHSPMIRRAVRRLRDSLSMSP